MQAVIELVDLAQNNLILVAPYLEPKGIGRLHDSLLAALYRGLDVLILTHDAEDLSSLASASLEALRRESVGLPGTLTVFSALEVPKIFLHLKVVVADDERTILGSANVTGKGFGANMEAGVVLGRSSAIEVRNVIQGVIASDLVQRIYSSKSPNSPGTGA